MKAFVTTALVLLAVAYGAYFIHGDQLFKQSAHGAGDPHGDAGHDEHDHDAHDHDSHAGHDHGDDAVVTLSEQARRNIGLKTSLVRLKPYTQYLAMPATISDWPGKTHVSITAPLTGVVNAIYISQGELIRSGQPLFSIRLTHQDLVKTQSDFLSSLGRLDVEDREIQRLTTATQSGAVAGKALIQSKYEREKLRLTCAHRGKPCCCMA